MTVTTDPTKTAAGGAFDASGNQIAVGNAASGATDSGNPIKVAGVYNSTKPTFTTGQRGDLQVGSRGSLSVTLFGQDSTANVWVAATGTTGIAASSFNTLYTQTFPALYNGATWDTASNNQSYVELASASRTTTQTGSDRTNLNARGVKVILNVTSAGTGSVTVSIQGKDAAGNYYTLLTGAAVTTNSTNVYTVYPGVTVTANASVSDIMPRTYRIVVTANNANAVTYSVAGDLIL